MARRIERRLPGAAVRRHYATVLDGLSVLLRPEQIGALHRVAGVTAVYPNLRYHPLTDSVPQVVGAPTLWGADLAGAGAGIKIAVIDDGVDAHHPYFASRGLVAPAGYPRGVRSYTTGKVIVARAFAPRGAARRDRLPFDPEVSRHATHVAGILAGDNGLIAPGDAGRPTVTGLSGVAPQAYIGNYRALAVPDPLYGSIGSTADLTAAVDAAVADGMDVINLSIGGTEIDPASDGLVRAVQGAVAAGVVVVIAAGNERELLGYGSIDSPGAAADAITVAATSSSRYFARTSAISGSAPVPALLRSFGVAVPDGEHAPRRVTGRLRAAAAVGDARLCSTRPAGSLTGLIALADRGGCSVLKKADVARAAGARAVLVPPMDASPPVPELDTTAVPVLVAPAPVVSALEQYLAGGGRASIDVRTATREEATLPGRRRDLLVRGPDALRPAAEAGPRRAGRRDPLVRSRLARRTSRGTGRSSTAPRWRRPSSRARPRCCVQTASRLDAGGGEGGPDGHRASGIRRCGRNARGVAAGCRRRSRRRLGCCRSRRRGRALLARLRRDRRRWRRLGRPHGARPRRRRGRLERVDALHRPDACRVSRSPRCRSCRCRRAVPPSSRCTCSCRPRLPRARVRECSS